MRGVKNTAGKSKRTLDEAAKKARDDRKRELDGKRKKGKK